MRIYRITLEQVEEFWGRYIIDALQGIFLCHCEGEALRKRCDRSNLIVGSTVRLLRPPAQTPPSGLAMTRQEICVIPAHQLWIDPHSGWNVVVT